MSNVDPTVEPAPEDAPAVTDPAVTTTDPAPKPPTNPQPGGYWGGI